MKLFAFIMSALFSVSVLAQDITLIVNGKPGGTFFARTKLYSEGLEAAGWTVKEVNAQKNAAVDLFNKLDTPVLMVWTDQMASVYPLGATEENFATIEYTAPLYLCPISGKESGTVGMPKMYLQEPVAKMGDFKFIPYKNTGAVLNAVVAGEIDFAYMNQSKATKLESMGYTCTPIPGVSQHATVMTRNVDSNFRQLLIDITLGEEFVAFHRQANFQTNMRDSHSAELARVQASETQWKSASK